MQGVARNFFILGIVMAIAGMMLGLKMAMTQDHIQMPVHAHIMVAGWLMSCRVRFYRLRFGQVADSLAGHPRTNHVARATRRHILRGAIDGGQNVRLWGREVRLYFPPA